MSLIIVDGTQHLHKMTVTGKKIVYRKPYSKHTRWFGP